MALAQFNMEVEKSSITHMIIECTTTYWTNGSAHMLVTKLNNEYEPDDRIL